ncbi:MAG: hypothetical protein MUO76_13925 [Anaerolineaceae bacterium]|nr:hypothetical protein [Anaerolineaceae bacterium]
MKANETDYVWDAKGNMLSDGESTYTYNHANQLTQLVLGSDNYEYVYNGVGDSL